MFIHMTHVTTNKETEDKDSLATKNFLATLDKIRSHVISDGFIQVGKESINITSENILNSITGLYETKLTFSYNLVEQ